MIFDRIYIYADIHCNMRMNSPKQFHVIEIPHTIMNPSDNSQPHLKKVLIHRFYAEGKIRAKVATYEKCITKMIFMRRRNK